MSVRNMVRESKTN